MTTNKVSGLVVTLRIELDKLSVDGGEALSLGACIQSLTSEGWHLTHVLEADDGALTAVLWRGWDVGVRPPPDPVAMTAGGMSSMPRVEGSDDG